LTQRLRGVTSFEKCALETISVARDFFDDDIATKVSQAWIDVGVITDAVGPVASLPIDVVASIPAAKKSRKAKPPVKRAAAAKRIIAKTSKPRKPGASKRRTKR